MTAPPNKIPELRAETIAKLDRIRDEIVYGYVHKKIFTELRDEIRERRPDKDGIFLRSYTRNYVYGQIMLIRRLADNGQDKPDSLWWVADRIRSNPEIGSRNALLDLVRARNPGDQWHEQDAQLKGVE